MADSGSISAAARKLNKTHTAVLYQLKQLENHVGFPLLERSQYRSQLTSKGGLFLAEARHFLQAQERLIEAAEKIERGSLSRWTLVYDAIFPVDCLFTVAKQMQQNSHLTLKFLSDSLSHVEKTFWSEELDFMISLDPPENRELVGESVGQLRSLLVAPQNHLFWTKNFTAPGDTKDWLSETLIMVRAIDTPWSQLSSGQQWSQRLIVNDFYAKKEALLRGLGIGWMPEHLIEKELREGLVIPLTIFPDSEKTYSVYYSTRSSLTSDPLYIQTKDLLQAIPWLKPKIKNTEP